MSMARKDIFDRIDSKMRNQLTSLGRSPRREEAKEESGYVDKRVSKRVIRRRARKPSTAAPDAAAPAAEQTAQDEGAETGASKAPEAAASDGADQSAADTGAAEGAKAATAATTDEAAESAASASAAEDGTSDAPAGDARGEDAAQADVTTAAGQEAESPATATAEEAAGDEADAAADQREPEQEVQPSSGGEEDAGGEAAPVEEAPAEEAGTVAATDAGEGASPEQDGEAAAAEETAEPSEGPAAEVPPVATAGSVHEAPPTTPAGKEVAAAREEAKKKSTSLEDLLREQGIVQHKPKKGRRIIDAAPVPDRRPIPKPVIRQDIVQQAMMRQARQQAGPGPQQDQPVGQQRDGRRRGRVHESMERELRAEREREKKMQRPGRRGRRKSIVQRPDMMFYPDRRSTRKKSMSGPPRKNVATMPKAVKRVIRIDNEISVGELAKELGIKSTDLVRKFIEMGQMVTVNQFVDFDTATLVAAEFEYTVENVAFKEEEIIEEVEDRPEDMVPRPPVITVMGHVDHGKTSILDRIRKTSVAAREAGGITQHIGAYQVQVKGQLLTFLDTPGHEAFTAMRARGAECTDLVVLVVAANDGVMPQTIEAINHARAADVPILVAINKIDLANTNVDRVKQELSEHELLAEDWGGDTVMVQVSATKGTGIDELLEMIALQSEVLELKANPDRPMRGVVIEAKLSKGVGPVATVLVQHGTLRTGDYLVAGNTYGRVRAMKDYAGKRVKAATPATPVEVHGLNGIPEAGENVAVVEDERAAKTLFEHRQAEERDRSLAKTSRATMDTLNELLAAGKRKDLNVVLKADVHGSLEAIKDSLSHIDVENTRLTILHSAVGGITENDVTLASTSRGMVIGFGVRPDVKATKLAEQYGVEIRTYRVIYELLEEIERVLKGMLDPVFREEVHGQVEVREVFKIPKIGVIAGCFVTNGTINRNHQARLLRDGVVTWEGRISSLKRFKEDAKEVAQGYECGVGLQDYHDIKKGDVIEAFTMVEVPVE